MVAKNNKVAAIVTCTNGEDFKKPPNTCSNNK